MRVDVVATVVLLSACASAVVAPAPAPPQFSVIAPDPSASHVAAQQPAGEYALDPRHTSVIWRVRHWGLALYTGRFDTISGILNFDPQNPANSSVSVRIPVNSVSTGILNRAGERAFDRDLAAYFGGEANPEITFQSRSIELTGPTDGRILGDLTLNGQTHPATFEARFEGGRIIPTHGRNAVGFSGRTVVRRSQWLTGNVHNSDAPGEEVEILVNVEFVKPAPAAAN